MHLDCLLDNIFMILNFLTVVIVFWICRITDWLLEDKILRGEKEREREGEGYHMGKMSTDGEPSPE